MALVRAGETVELVEAMLGQPAGSRGVVVQSTPDAVMVAFQKKGHAILVPPDKLRLTL